MEDQWSIPVGKSITVRVLDSQNQLVLMDSMRLSDYDSFADFLKLKPTDHLGNYTIQVMVTGSVKSQSVDYSYEEGAAPPKGYRIFASGQFEVESFRPAEFEVTDHFLHDNYIVGDTCTGTVSARYLFGAPMRNQQVSWRVRTSRMSFEPPGHDGYSFGVDTWYRDQENYSRGSQLLPSETTKLDDHGMLSVSAPLPVGQIRNTIFLTLEADVTSRSRRFISGRAAAILHGGEYYIGIRQSSTFLQEKDTLRYDVISVSPDGKMSPGQRLDIKVVKREWDSVRKAGADGRYFWVTEKTDSVLTNLHVTTTASVSHSEFVPSMPGLYFVTAEGKDKRGNVVRSSASFYVTGTGYVAWERSDDDRIGLVSDAKSYKPRDTAHVIVKSPYEEANALITLERDGVMKQWTTTLTGSAPEIAVPIGKKYLPNIFVSVVLLQGRLGQVSPSEN
ncbi:MAG: hypothetical protein M1339_01760, partial [Bacteroidetes bacterium]|nr:hypothetical protein [Bacteroidota bacterium]